MKSSTYLGLVAALSLLLGLSFGQLHEQHQTIQTLREQVQAKRTTGTTPRTHTRCVQLLQRQRMRMQVEHYEQALEELAHEHLIQAKVYSEPVLNLSPATRRRK